ncbi:hypothetical protein EGW08_003333 [Elysia chlorotica]|uniref:Uncharacterized protein n=1 Tax=Elysia chlorotica TaxID=188477 RepID=A0A433U525_ELYCH|nr:hypothetical protein EGW08_003333 [Elysia chlorotica]
MKPAFCLFQSSKTHLSKFTAQRLSRLLSSTPDSTKMDESFETKRKACEANTESVRSPAEADLVRTNHQSQVDHGPSLCSASPVYSRSSNECSPNTSYNAKQTTPRLRTNFTAKKSRGSRMSLTPEKEATWAFDLLERSRSYSHTFIDSHCHIDLVYDRLQLPQGTLYSDFRETHATSYPVNYEGCVAIFCSPGTFDLYDPQDAVLKTVLRERGVWLALGCHPKNAASFKPSSLDGLRKMLCTLPNVVALGEIGLDYSGDFSNLADVQREVLVSQLKLAVELDLPLVIHCRDADDELLEILQKHVPREHRIHRHCFTQDLSTALRWLDAFPNMFIGFTPVITYRSARDPALAARDIPLDRLLLETDAPYFVPGSVKDRRLKITHPGFALFTAEKIAELRGIPVDDVLEACRNNTRRMYGI